MPSSELLFHRAICLHVPLVSKSHFDHHPMKPAAFLSAQLYPSLPVLPQQLISPHIRPSRIALQNFESVFRQNILSTCQALLIAYIITFSSTKIKPDYQIFTHCLSHHFPTFPSLPSSVTPRQTSFLQSTPITNNLIIFHIYIIFDITLIYYIVYYNIPICTYQGRSHSAYY